MYDLSVAAHIASILDWNLDDWLANLFRETDIFNDHLDRVADAVAGLQFRG